MVVGIQSDKDQQNNKRQITNNIKILWYSLEEHDMKDLLDTLDKKNGCF
jgi:hypothetical protein